MSRVTGMDGADLFRLDGKVVVVTGGASGIGKGTAELLRARGATCVAADIRADDRTLAVDVRERAQVEALIAHVVGHYGRIDGLVNAAGITGEAALAELTEAQLDSVLRVNLYGTMFCCQAVARVLLDVGRPGAIVNVTSAAAYLCKPGVGAYSMSKAAVAALTGTLAGELGPSGIRVNAVAPGFIETPMTVGRLADPGLRLSVVEDRRSRTPLRRTGQPEDVASVVAFLLADAAAFVTGQVIHPNGGLLMTT